MIISLIKETTKDFLKVPFGHFRVASEEEPGGGAVSARYWRISYSDKGIDISEMQMFESNDGSDTNLALGVTCAVSATDAGSAAGAVDGLTNFPNVWRNYATTGWIYADLVTVYAIKSLKIYFGMSARIPTSLDIHCSADANSWEFIDTITPAQATGWQTFIDLQ